MVDSPPYWSSDTSQTYEKFNIALPSEIVAYHTAYKILGPEGKKVLDFGCFQGNSSQNILRAGAKEVTGVDCYQNIIHAARSNYENEPGLHFQHIPKNRPIPNSQLYEACAMTFVHPVIDSITELDDSFLKIYRALKVGGNLMLLGLNPKSFRKRFDFVHYDFNKKLRSDAQEDLQDGEPFTNNLYLPNGNNLCLTDYFWKEQTLVGNLEKNGFIVDNIIDLNDESLDEKLLKQFRQVRRAISKKHEITWKDEWTAPLYQIIIAKKT
ncbi:class I SAM-dependent methyltransferase [Candidatus Woesearchaeota archaeon]|nr:class I SAM-dependent methyltransferase [Candidatus Woesearchaeota archaeon]